MKIDGVWVELFKSLFNHLPAVAEIKWGYLGEMWRPDGLASSGEDDPRCWMAGRVVRVFSKEFKVCQRLHQCLLHWELMSKSDVLGTTM